MSLSKNLPQKNTKPHAKAGRANVIGRLATLAVMATAACGALTTGNEAPVVVEVASVKVRAQIHQRRDVGTLATNRAQAISEGATGFGVESPSDICTGEDCVLLPLLPLALAVHSAGGAVVGAVSGVDESREDIHWAVSTVTAVFRPELLQVDLESAFLKQLQSYAQASDGPCITKEGTSGKCRTQGQQAGLVATFGYELKRSLSPDDPAGLDFTAVVTAAAYPEGALGLDCVSWLYRRHAGNLFELDDDGGALLKSRLGESSLELARLVAADIYDEAPEPPEGTLFKRTTGNKQLCMINGEFAEEISRSNGNP